MPIFAQFYTPAVPGPWNNHSTTPIPALGDRALIIIDGRLGHTTARTLAHEECVKRGFSGYSLQKTKHLRDAKFPNHPDHLV